VALSLTMIRGVPRSQRHPFKFTHDAHSTQRSARQSSSFNLHRYTGTGTLALKRSPCEQRAA
jgi:hypothetical protein